MVQVPPDLALKDAKEHRPIYWVFFLLIVALGIAVFFAANYQLSSEYANTEETPAHKSKAPALVRVLIDFGDSKRAFQGTAREGLEVRQALYEVAEVGELDLQIKNGAITKLDGLRSTEKNGQWRLYLNGDILQDSLSRGLSPGDQVTLRYER